MKTWIRIPVLVLFTVLVASAALGQEVSFKDPTGDDKGPGAYVYPTDKVYTAGSFDLTELKMKVSGDKADFSVSVGTKLEDPWGMGVGFATQMIFIFIDKDGKAGSGHTEGLPGLNVQFAPESAWEKVIILSPQPASRVNSEIKAKAAGLAADIVVPRRTAGAGKSISAKVKLDAPPAT